MSLTIGGSGPPPIPNGRGREHLRREEPYYDVHLDAGTFDWLWRIVESRFVQHANSSTATMLPEAVDVSRKAVIAFRDAVAATGLPPPLPKKKRRVVKVPKIG